jgi:hypothetical protein
MSTPRRYTWNPATGSFDIRPLTPGETLRFKSRMRRFLNAPTSRKSAISMLKKQGILSDEFITELLNQPKPKPRRSS